MRRVLTASLLTIALVSPVLAGDVNAPPRSEPPPCTENCKTATTTSTADSIKLAILEFVLSLIRK